MPLTGATSTSSVASSRGTWGAVKKRGTSRQVALSYLSRNGTFVDRYRLHVIEHGIDTSTAEGRAMFGMLSVLAELQRELIIANTRDGLAAARLRGRKGGRRPRLNREQAFLAQQLYDAGERTVQQIADPFGVPRTTVYGHFNAANKGQRPVGERTAASS